MRFLEPKYAVPHIFLLFTYNYKVKIFVKYAIPHLNHALDRDIKRSPSRWETLLKFVIVC